MTSPPPPPPPSAEAEKLLKKIKTLEEDHANLREEMSKLVISGEVHGLPPPRYGGGNDELWKAAHGHQFTDKDCLNILECMGQAIHIFCPQGRIFYWNRSAENLYGYSAAEAIGRGVCELIVMSRDFTFAEVIIHRCRMGQSWTGQFPVRHKMGHMLPVIVMNTPFYDDDGTLIGVISLTCDSRPFKDTQVSVSDAEEVEIGQDFSRRQSGVTTRIGLNSDQSLQTVIASKFTNLASKVGSKVRSKMKTGESNVFGESGSGDSHRSDHASVLPDHREDENCSGASTPRGDPAGTPFGIFTSFATGKSPAQAQGNFIDESEGKPGIHKILASKAEVWIGKKAIQWSGKGTERETSEPQSGRFVWPWMQGEQDSNCRHSAVKSEIQTGDYNRPVANEASGSWSSFNGSGTSSASSCGRSSSSAIHKLDVETHSLDYEILWEDLTVGEQIGRGSCGTVYHGLWYGSDIAIKIFSKQEYSEEVIFSFKQEVSLMNRLRHPNILLFMGAVTSPQRLCIVTEFLPRFILNFPFQE